MSIFPEAYGQLESIISRYNGEMSQRYIKMWMEHIPHRPMLHFPISWFPQCFDPEYALDQLVTCVVHQYRCFGTRWPTASRNHDCHFSTKTTITMRADKRGLGELEVEPLFTLHGSLTNMNVLDMIDAIWPRGRVCWKLHSPDKAIISCLQLILMTRSPFTAPSNFPTDNRCAPR